MVAWALPFRQNQRARAICDKKGDLTATKSRGLQTLPRPAALQTPERAAHLSRTGQEERPSLSHMTELDIAVGQRRE
jgi:hypothetical protein